VLDQLIQAVRGGESRALVIHGEAGVGKTALLDYVAAQALGCRVIRAGGVQSEMELAFASLHQLCAPELDRLDALPVPQRQALQTAFGLSAGPRPDLFMVGLAILGLLSDVAGERPLLCLVDDQQWLDRASAQVLAFVARRLGAESLGLVFAVRDLTPELSGLADLPLGGLREPEAGVLLDAVLSGPLDARVRAQIIAEARGNPLALLELPRALTPTDLAGGFGLPAAMSIAGRIEDRFSRRARTLPEQTRQLLLLAAADPSGDAALLWRAAASLRIAAEAAEPAVEAGLAQFGSRVAFRHPLVRSAVYRSASPARRRKAHRALAEATDAHLDPDRRAWHRSQAVVGPDAEVAQELEQSAGRAQSRGGLAAAGAFLQRAAALTLDPGQRAERALSAAQAHLQAGAFDPARDLLALAEAGSLSDTQQARVDLVRAQLAYLANRGNDAPPMLLKAAARLEPIDSDLARATYLDALAAAIFAGRLASPGGDVLAVARAAATAPPPRWPIHAPDLLLDGLGADYNQRYAAQLPLLRKALATFGADMSTEEELHWSSLATVTAMRIWDDDHWEALSTRQVRLARDVGARSDLSLALTLRSYLLLFAGDLAAAASLVDETQAVKEATGGNLAPYGALGLAAFRGEENQALLLRAATEDDVNRRGEGLGLTLSDWAITVLHNGLGQYDKAFAAAQRATAYEPDQATMVWPAAEIIEAAARSGATECANAACQRLTEMTAASGTTWALGLQARCRALLAEAEAAERHYELSIDLLGRTRVRTELARAHLLYGEWLRRERRRNDARYHLRRAHIMFEQFGMAGFAERTARELRAAGGTTQKRAATAARTELTTQEAQIARMAREGLSNPEIATRLFLSARTVQYHLRKVFTKLGITSRSQLGRALADEPRPRHSTLTPAGPISGPSG
jgi:DNA-binding CsgD family transcriptional regulator